MRFSSATLSRFPVASVNSHVKSPTSHYLYQHSHFPSTMRIKRGKHYKRIVRFYVLNYGFSPPFKVLIDGNFLLQCVKIQQDAKEMLSRVLGGVVHIDIRLVPCVPP